MTAFSSFQAEDLAAHADSLRQLARDLLADDELAQDAVQDAFVTALERPPKTDSSLRVWLRRVVRHCAIDIGRAERARRRRELLAARGEAADVAAQFDLQETIFAAVRTLREPYRTAIWLRYYEERSPAEIAQRLGEPVKTVKTRLARGLAALRERLDRRAGGREAWTRALLPLAIGGAMEGKKVALAIGAVALVAGTWWFWPEPSAANRDAVATRPAPVVASADVPSRATAAESERHALSTPVSVPAAAADAALGTLVVRATWHDGTPAADVAILLKVEGEPALDRCEQRVISDSAGLARADLLQPGTVAVTSERGGTAKAVVVAGRAEEVALTIPRGLDVQGVVEDRAGNPLAGACVWLANGRQGWLGGRVVGRTDAAGTFRLLQVDPKHSLGAFASGFAPSALLDLETLAADAAAPREARLQLTRTGAAVAGTVVDAEDKPIAGAMVAVGRTERVLAPNSRLEPWTPRVEVTDEAGRFRCEGLEPGGMPVAARAPGFVTFARQWNCTAGETTTGTIVLQRGVTVTGVARDEQGNAVGGALVTSPWQPFERAMLLVEPPDREPAFARPVTRTLADGRYALHHLAPGEVHLLAGKWARSAFEAGTVGTAATTLVARPGDGLRWDPRLSVGLRIRGRVVHQDGSSVRTVTGLSAIPEVWVDGAEPVQAFVQRDGSFTFTHCADVPYTVAFESRARERASWTYQTTVRPGGEDVVLRVPPPPAPRANGRITGRVVDAANRITATAPLRVTLNARGSRHHAKLDGDRFAHEVPADRYRVVVHAGEASVLVGPELDVGPGQHVDAGDLVTSKGCTVTIALVAPPGLTVGSPSGSVGQGHAQRVLRWDGRRLRAEDVVPGVHRIRVWGEGWSAAPRDVSVQSGPDHELEIAVQPGVMRTLVVTFPFPEQWERGDLVLRDERGNLVGDMGGFGPGAAGLRPLTWTATLPLGTFTLDASTDAGHARSWRVDFTDPATAKSALRFSLR